MMARAKSRKGRATVQQSMGVRLVDRTAVTPNPHLRVGIVLIDAPDGNGKDEAYRAYRGDPLANMLRRGDIDQVQELAGRHWQQAYERVELGGARAIDPTREAVDGGQIPEPFTDAQRKAAMDLAKAGRAIGALQESVVRDVLVAGMSMEQIALARGFNDQGAIKFYGRLFRESLKTLSVVFGFAMGERR